MSATSVETGYAVVAVDGTEEGDAAVAFAAREASREGLALRLVHVMPAWVPVGPLLMIVADEGRPALGAYASESLASAARVAADLAPELEITTELLLGSRVSEVVRFAEHAQFIAVGRRPASALDRAWSGGTMDGIVSRARCPVHVVPHVSRADGPPRVVAAYKSADHAPELLEAAFRAADELGSELEIVHAWKLSTGYDDMIASRVSEARWNRDQKDEIRDVLAAWQKRYTHVPVRIRVVHEYPVRAIVEASREADRLVLVKPLHGAFVHHLGRTARGVLRFAQCPVDVEPARNPDEPTGPAIAIEREGALVP